jgi:hypothetical protein
MALKGVVAALFLLVVADALGKVQASDSNLRDIGGGVHS